MLTNKKVAFIGAGSMAEAMISGILAKDILQPEQIHVTNRRNKEKLQLLQDEYGVETFTDLQDVLPKMDIIVFAIKPKDISETVEKIRRYTTNKQVMISVLAGVSTSCISRLLEHEAPVIRTMPNTSAAVGQSITAIAPGSYAGSDQVTLTKTLLEAIGEVVIVEEEKLDAITGLSGSGPAYIYYLIEAMEIGAKEIGIDEKLAKQLIAQVLIGAAERVKSTDLSSQTLYKQVMSPGGTTEAGFTVLENYNYQEAMVECIKRAAQRSTELGKLYSFVK